MACIHLVHELGTKNYIQTLKNFLGGKNFAEHNALYQEDESDSPTIPTTSDTMHNFLF